MRNFSTGQSGRTAESSSHAPNAALLIDFDNVTMGVRSDLQNQLRRLMNSEMIKGKVAVQRAYADWRRYPQYIVPLSEASIDLIFAPAFGSNKKNATDIRLAIDALELVFTRPEIGTIILLSGDSDFSSLVLKLKEYGKYIIGVGIRESSSDLLIQNCDEYYSYNELTGFTKEHEVEHVSKDPWELVVEAVVLMRKGDDVMRSDRLKQVMQGIDPTFSEKEAGFSRFSKFVTEAQKRGLLTLTKLDNGQYAVDVGDNANVSPDAEAALRTQPSSEARESRGRSRRGRRGGSKSRGGSGLSLAEAFELMRQALLAIGAVDEQAQAEAVRDKMIELHGSDGDPIFDRPKFQRLQRQAHDADLIELVKQDDDYVMKLSPNAVAKAPEVKAAEEDEGAADEQGEEPVKQSASRSRSRSRRAKTSSTASKTSDDEDAAAPSGDAEPVEAADESAAKSKSRRSPRHRRGSRGRESAKKAEGADGADGAKVGKVAGDGEATKTAAPDKTTESKPASTDSQAASTGGRRVGPRRGGRSHRGEAKSASGGSVGKVESDSAASAASTPATSAPATPAPQKSAPASEASAPAPKPTGGATEPSPDEAGGLLKRMSAAFQKAMRGEEDAAGE